MLIVRDDLPLLVRIVVVVLVVDDCPSWIVICEVIRGKINVCFVACSDKAGANKECKYALVGLSL